jgi:hypothetical protein
MMRRFGWVRLAVVAVGLALAGCDSQDTGYVQVVLPRTGAGTGAGAAPPLFLDGARLDFSRVPAVVMQFRVGRVSLKTADSTWSPSICRAVVRKNRITVLNVAPAEIPPRCACQVRAPESTPSDPVCM